MVDDINAISASVKNGGVYGVAVTRTVHRRRPAAACVPMKQRHTGHQKDGVVALVVDPSGHIVRWGITNPNVSCWHGETSAIIRLGGALPAGAAAVGTLKP